MVSGGERPVGRARLKNFTISSSCAPIMLIREPPPSSFKRFKQCISRYGVCVNTTASLPSFKQTRKRSPAVDHLENSNG